MRVIGCIVLVHFLFAMPDQASNWNRDELVLILNLYRQLKSPASNTQLSELSSELKTRAAVASPGQPSDYRSAAALSMMLARFRALEMGEPSARGTSTATEDVWDEFGRSPKQNAKRVWDAAQEVRERWAVESSPK